MTIISFIFWYIFYTYSPQQTSEKSYTFSVLFSMLKKNLKMEECYLSISPYFLQLNLEFHWKQIFRNKDKGKKINKLQKTTLQDFNNSRKIVRNQHRNERYLLYVLSTVTFIKRSWMKCSQWQNCSLNFSLTITSFLTIEKKERIWRGWMKILPSLRNQLVLALPIKHQLFMWVSVSFEATMLF